VSQLHKIILKQKIFSDMSKTISLVLFVSMIAGIRAACMCKDYIGVHCGDCINDAEPTLREEAPGDCNPSIIYQCAAANIPATSKGYCSYCAKGEKPGTDYCAIGRKGSFIKIVKTKKLSHNLS
jgi:hypothetical protein